MFIVYIRNKSYTLLFMLLPNSCMGCIISWIDTQDSYEGDGGIISWSDNQESQRESHLVE